MAIFDQDAEQMDRGELAQLQLERLQATLTRVYKNVKFYKKKFDEIGFLPEDCQSLEDLARLPFTTRHDLARAYPYEMFAVPLREVRSIKGKKRQATKRSTAMGGKKRPNPRTNRAITYPNH